MTGPWWAVAVAVAAVGCAGAGGNGAGGNGIGAGATATVSAGTSSATAHASAGASASASASAANTAAAGDTRSHQPKPIWIQSLQMTSATTGWALHYSGKPNSSSSPVLLLARTTDGGRLWTDVTPPEARPLLATPDAGQVLDSVDGDRAYLAVTGATQESNTAVNTTMVFTTTDGGRAWADSAPLQAVSTASQLSFSDPEHGFLMLGGNGGAMGQDPVWLYRTSDGGAHWALAAATPAQTATVASGTGAGQIPAACDKNGLAFATATIGWIASTCNADLAKGLLVSQDGGTSWGQQPLPLSSAPAGTAGTVEGPQFVDGTGFLTVEPQPSGAALLATHDAGQSWQQLPLPPGLQYPQIKFFTASQGVLVAGEAQGAFGGTFYTTSDGGQTWTPVPQGVNLTRLGVSVDFASRLDGFAWTNGLETDPVPPTTIYQTTNSGRSWHAVTPRLVG